LNLSVTRKLFLGVAICAASLSAIAQSPNASAAREIAKIDGEYSDLSIAKGMPAASVEYFAEDGIAFAPGAVNGKKYWAGRTDFPGTSHFSCLRRRAVLPCPSQDSGEAT
jgi:hypothetical protein